MALFHGGIDNGRDIRKPPRFLGLCLVFILVTVPYMTTGAVFGLLRVSCHYRSSCHFDSFCAIFFKQRGLSCVWRKQLKKYSYKLKESIEWCVFIGEIVISVTLDDTVHRLEENGSIKMHLISKDWYCWPIYMHQPICFESWEQHVSLILVTFTFPGKKQLCL